MTMLLDNASRRICHFIITIIISSNVIGALTALFFANNSVEL